ncbi:IclR family transcriptional regulator [Streptomyces capparidis]
MEESGQPPAAGRTAGPHSGRGVLEGAFTLLDAVERAGEAGLTRLAAATGLPKTTAHRLLDQLVALGAVERRGGRYRVGARIFRLGSAWQPHPGLLAAASGPVRGLAGATGATVAVCVLREGGALTVTGVPGEVDELSPFHAGLVWPWTTAAGKILVAEAYGAGLPLGPLPGEWPREAEAIRDRGAAVDPQQVVPGVMCVAVPLHARDGRAVASLVALVPATSRLRRVEEAVIRAGRAVDAGLRHRTARSAQRTGA